MISKKLNHLITIIILLVSTSAFSQNENFMVKNATEAIAWKFKTNDAVYASPVIHEAIIYVGSLNGNFYAIDSKTGEEKWKYKSSNKILSSALIYQNKIYFAYDNKLIALDLQGKLIWKFTLSKDSVTNKIDPWDFHHSSPIVYDSVIYVGNEKGLVFGANAETGRQVFKCQTETKKTIRTTPLVHNNKIIFGDWEGVLHAYDLNTQKKIWAYDTKKDITYGWKNSIHGQPQMFKNSVIFAGRSSRLYSLDINTGERNWVYKSPTDQWLVGGPVISNGTIYIGSSDQCLFHAFDAKNGKLKWQIKLDCRIWGTAGLKDDKIYIGSNSLFEINKKTGKIIKQYTFKKVHEDKKYGKYIDKTANIHSSPIVFENKVIFGSDDGFVYAISLD